MQVGTSDDMTEIEAELFAPAMPFDTTPQGAALPPTAKPVPQPAPNDPLAALKALSEEERYTKRAQQKRLAEEAFRQLGDEAGTKIP